VQARRKQGLGNETHTWTSRSYWNIARANLFALFNNILFEIGVALIALGRYGDALKGPGSGAGWANPTNTNLIEVLTTELWKPWLTSYNRI
jgi:hypothetical protein